jgi:hypothetical protein
MTARTGGSSHLHKTTVTKPKVCGLQTEDCARPWPCLSLAILAALLSYQVNPGDIPPVHCPPVLQHRP